MTLALPRLFQGFLGYAWKEGQTLEELIDDVADPDGWPGGGSCAWAWGALALGGVAVWKVAAGRRRTSSPL